MTIGYDEFPEGFGPSSDQFYYGLRHSFALEDSHGVNDLVPGFVDVLGTKYLGSGKLFNTAGTVYQFLASLAHSRHDTILDILEDHESVDPLEITRRIARLREDQVLEGMRILDLGCGEWPAFALVTAALGASIYTADGAELVNGFQVLEGRHTTLDICDKNAARTIENATGGEFDIVTDSAVLALPGDRTSLKTPSFDTFTDIARELLQPGGVLVSLVIHSGSQKAYERI